MFNLYFLMSALFVLMAILAAADASLTSLNVLPWFNGLRWVRVHLITLGAMTEALFGALPLLTALHFNRPRPRFRWDIWLTLNAGLLTLLIGIPIVNQALIFTGGTLIFTATTLLIIELSRMRPAARAKETAPSAGHAGRPFYIAGLSFFLLGIIIGTGLWFGWGEALRIQVPLEAHIHANNWGLMALVFAGLIIDTYPCWAGRSLAWGDYDKMVELTTMIAYRQGVGDALAEGPARLAAGLGFPELSNTVKGQAIPAYDPRGIKGMGIAYATSNRGACHLRAYTPAAELNIMPFQSLKADPLEWDGKGKLVKAFQDIHAFSDSLDLCKFSAFAQGVEEYTAQYAAFVGLPEFTVDDMLKTGERIYNLERYYNNLAGFAEGSDYLPYRFTHEASTEPGNLGHVCELDLMLAEYYGARGWKEGVVPDWKLQELEVI